jgi:hypothetical protein
MRMKRAQSTGTSARLSSRPPWYTSLLFLTIACGGLTNLAAEQDETEVPPLAGGAGTGGLGLGVGSAGGPSVTAGNTTNSSGGAAQSPTLALGGHSSTAPTSEGHCAAFGPCTTDLGDCTTKLAPHCVRSCFAEDDDSVQAVCDRGNYRCPDGSIAQVACPENACVNAPRRCCDANTGAISWEDCNGDGYVAQCPMGQTASKAPCAPAGVDVDDCQQLEGTSCKATTHHCDSGLAFCDCEEDQDTGQLVWRCLVYLILS